MDKEQIQEKLLNWYQLNHRPLPFRESTDPYRIWISEVMLQQTQVSTVIPYYNQFIEKFPTVLDLSRAEEEDVYKLWAGLGYYSRAKNLLKCAKEIVEVHGGEFPKDYKKALKLPGIGPYTAGAVLSIAYNLKHPAVDGNVMRVISRIYNIKEDITLPKTKKIFEEKVQSILPDDARHFNQAIMELGALVCTPQKPKCEVCPVKDDCKANLLGIQDQLPVKTKKPKNKNTYMGVGILNKDQKILLVKYHKGLLSGLWGLPAVEGSDQSHAKENLLKAIEDEYGLKINKCEKRGEETHLFTHRTWKMDIYDMEVSLKAPEFYLQEASEIYERDILWQTKDKIKDYPISAAFQKVLEKFGLTKRTRESKK